MNQPVDAPLNEIFIKDAGWVAEIKGKNFIRKK